MKRRLVVTVILLFLAAVGFLVSVNGIRPHPYTKEQLQSDFLERVEDSFLALAEGYELIEQKHANSMTFLIKDITGKYAWASYVCSPLTEKYKLYHFYETATAENSSTFTYTVNDGMMRYNITVSFGDTIKITGSENMYSVLTIKMLTLSFVIMLIMVNLLLKGVKEEKHER